VFSIPRALRGLFERERRLLGLLSRTAYAALLRSVQAPYERNDVRPGAVASIQTFGSFAANFHPHIHALVTEGVFTPDGEFLPLPGLDTAALEEVFRRLLLTRLHRAHRLSQAFLHNLLGWQHSGFSVWAEQVVGPDQPDRVERLARYLLRAPVRLDTISWTPGGPVHIRTPPDPRSGRTSITLDPLDWIHAVTTQIPDPRQHAVRYYGAYSNRSRGCRRPQATPDSREPSDPASPSPPPQASTHSQARKASWARLLRRLLEVDPLLCPRCRVELRVVSVITEPAVVDRILRHIAARPSLDPFRPRPPPAGPVPAEAPPDLPA
jgi:hypothetical protein